MTNTELPASTTGESSALAESALSLGKALGLGLAFLAVGPNLIFSPTTFGLTSGNGSWVSLLAAAPIYVGLVFAVSFFAKRFVVTGSLMSYMGDAVGPRSRDVTGISLVLGYVVALPVATVLLLIFAQGLLSDSGITDLTSTTSQIILCVGALAVAAAISAVGVDFSVKAAVALSLVCIPLVLILIVGVVLRQGVALDQQIGLDGVTFGSVVNGVVLVFASYVGFEGVTALARETKDPRRNVPRLLTMMMTLAFAVALLSVIVLIPVFLTHSDDYLAGQSFVSILTSAAGMEWLKIPLDLTLTAAYFASVVAVCNDSSRVVATAGRDGLLPSALAKVNERTRTPLRALIAVAVVGACILIVSQAALKKGPIDTFLNLFPSMAYLWLLPYAAICLGLAYVGMRSSLLGHAILGAASAAAIVFVTVWSITHATGTVARVSPYIVYGAVIVLFAARQWSGRKSSAENSAKTSALA